MPLLMAPLRPRPGPLRRWGLLVRLILRVGRDVVHSAAQVAPACARAGGLLAGPSSSCRWTCTTCTPWRRWR
jgi:hypothetical protein